MVNKKEKPKKRMPVLVRVESENYLKLKPILDNWNISFSDFNDEMIELSLESYETKKPIPIEWIEDNKNGEDKEE